MNLARGSVPGSAATGPLLFLDVSPAPSRQHAFRFTLLLFARHRPINRKRSGENLEDTVQGPVETPTPVHVLTVLPLTPALDHPLIRRGMILTSKDSADAHAFSPADHMPFSSAGQSSDHNF